MQACPPEEQLSRLLAEALAEAERTTLELHVEGCRHCQEALERLTRDTAVRPPGPADMPAPPALALPAGAWLDAGDGEKDALPCPLAPSTVPGSLGRLGGHEILGVVGRGGMGVVLKGHDPLLRRFVAIKVFAPHLAFSGAARQRFLREARAAAAVVHEHVVAIHGVGAGPPPYLVMEFIDGVTLEQRLARGGPLEVEAILRIAAQAAAGLAAAHARGLIHRDIKPANILLQDGGGRVKLTDFGLARAVDDVSLTQSGALAGTPLFMSPEQANGEPLDPRSDLFSLGGVLYTLCTGRPPFRAGGTAAVLRRVCEDTPQPVRAVNPAVPDWLAAVVTKLLAKAPAERFQSAAEVVAALQGNEAVPLPPGRAGPPGRARRRRWLAAAGGLAALAIGAAVWLSLAGPPAGDGGAPPRRGHRPTAGAKPLPPVFRNRFGIEFVRVPRGKSWLGGGGGLPGSRAVDVPHDFYLGKYEVTQGQWRAVTGHNPSSFSRTGKGRDAVKDVSDEELTWFPVEMVSGDEAWQFAEQLNRLAPEAGWVCRLPTVTEWEYACRGGPLADPAESAFHYYLRQPANQLLPGQANFQHAAGLNRTCKVGSYPPNRLGLYDMHGNVFEWCGPPEGKFQPHRGGCYEFPPDRCWASASDGLPPVLRHDSLGLRLALVPADNGGE